MFLLGERYPINSKNLDCYRKECNKLDNSPPLGTVAVNASNLGLEFPCNSALFKSVCPLHMFVLYNTVQYTIRIRIGDSSPKAQK